jgi:hypothetical protein
MVTRRARPSLPLIALLGASVVVGVVTLRGPLAVGGKYSDLAIGVVVLFGAVLLYGRFRISVAQARRRGGFREWDSWLTSRHVSHILLCLAIGVGTWHIYEACLRIFIKVFE